VIVDNGPPPGDLGGPEAAEAALDVEWSGAVAPNATIDFVGSASTFASDGFDLSAAYIVDHALAPVVSASFGECEIGLTASGLAFYDSLWAQAAAQGMTVVVASGDSGSSVCGGVPSVSGICSTPYDVCVGGTQFDDTPETAYWGVPDPVTRASALSYIPERAWNEPTLGAAGGGGASAVHPKPVWQMAPGVPNDGKRDLPDLALASAVHDGYLLVVGHSASQSGLATGGGTSFAAPSFAGLMALLVQQTGSWQGNANPALYRLGNDQYAHGGPAVFHDVIAGDNVVAGVPGFACGPGYDQVTGLGSVDAGTLAASWATVPAPDFGLAAAPGDLQRLAPGEQATFSVQLDAWNGFDSAVALSLSGLPPGVTAAFDPPTLAGPGTSSLVLATAKSAATGLLSLAITATGGGVTHSLPLGLLLAFGGADQAIAYTTLPSLLLNRLTIGPDSALWFTVLPFPRPGAGSGGLLGRLTTARNLSLLPLPDCNNCSPFAIATGPDRALWFSESNPNRLSRATTGGAVTEFKLNEYAAGLATGADGALWFNEIGDERRIGRLTTSGSLTEYRVPTQFVPGIEIAGNIAAGPDGALWFTEGGPNKIGRITTSGRFAEFPIPTPAAGPLSIVAGLDGAMWFSEAFAMKVGRITTAGVISEFATGFPYGWSMGQLAAGPDGNIWFPAGVATRGPSGAFWLLGRIRPGGRLAWFTFPPVAELIAGTDHRLWFIGGDLESIGSVEVPREPACVASDTTLCIDDRPGDGRYRVEVVYQTAQGGGRSGEGHALALSSLGIDHGGAFWFFSPDNPEMLVKVLDGCAVNGRRWVFYAADTNVGLTTTVTDFVTGAIAVYRNDDRHAALPVEDTAALPCPAGAVPAPAARPGGAGEASAAVLVAAASRSSPGSAPGPCVPDEATLCLDDQPGDRRYAVKAAYSTAQGGGKAGSGHGVSLGSLGVGRGGLFWFFGLDNPEMLVKVIDGCALNSAHWAFLAATTNVGFTVTVIDTATGRQQTYANPDGHAAAPVEDTGAFTCP
jgi:streptogramin lyase